MAALRALFALLLVLQVAANPLPAPAPTPPPVPGEDDGEADPNNAPQDQKQCTTYLTHTDFGYRGQPIETILRVYTRTETVYASVECNGCALATKAERGAAYGGLGPARVFTATTTMTVPKFETQTVCATEGRKSSGPFRNIPRENALVRRRDQVEGRPACTRTVAADLVAGNGDGTSTVHTATRTVYESIECGGCGLEISTIPTTTSNTGRFNRAGRILKTVTAVEPATVTSTVCQEERLELRDVGLGSCTSTMVQGIKPHFGPVKTLYSSTKTVNAFVECGGCDHVEVRTKDWLNPGPAVTYRTTIMAEAPSTTTRYLCSTAVAPQGFGDPHARPGLPVQDPNPPSRMARSNDPSKHNQDPTNSDPSKQASKDPDGKPGADPDHEHVMDPDSESPDMPDGDMQGAPFFWNPRPTVTVYPNTVTSVHHRPSMPCKPRIPGYVPYPILPLPLPPFGHFPKPPVTKRFGITITLSSGTTTIWVPDTTHPPPCTVTGPGGGRAPGPPIPTIPTWKPVMPTLRSPTQRPPYPTSTATGGPGGNGRPPGPPTPPSWPGEPPRTMPTTWPGFPAPWQVPGTVPPLGGPPIIPPRPPGPPIPVLPSCVVVRTVYLPAPTFPTFTLRLPPAPPPTPPPGSGGASTSVPPAAAPTPPPQPLPTLTTTVWLRTTTRTSTIDCSGCLLRVATVWTRVVPPTAAAAAGVVEVELTPVPVVVPAAAVATLTVPADSPSEATQYRCSRTQQQGPPGFANPAPTTPAAAVAMPDKGMEEEQD